MPVYFKGNQTKISVFSLLTRQNQLYFIVKQTKIKVIKGNQTKDKEFKDNQTKTIVFKR